MTVNEFVNQMWYVTQIVVIDEATNFDNIRDIEDLKKIAIWHGSVMSTMSEMFKKTGKRNVKRYGIMDNHMVIEV